MPEKTRSSSGLVASARNCGGAARRSEILEGHIAELAEVESQWVDHEV